MKTHGSYWRLSIRVTIAALFCGGLEDPGGHGNVG